VFPPPSGQLGAGRQRYALPQPAQVPAGATANLFQAGLDLSYTLDLVGGNRRELEGVRAAIDYQRFQVEATWLSLTSSVVATAIQAASLRAQLQVTREVVANANQSLKVINAQVQLGALARGALLQQQTLIAQQQAQIPPLEKALAQTRHQLAVLAGRLPGDAGLPDFDIDALVLPRELPLSVPATLVRQRPDVRASEALLHEASAQIGVATAALYPQITLSGGVNRQSFKIDKLFDTGTTGWSLAAGLVQPIFNGGALQAKKRASVAAYDAAQAQYQSTVLNAFLSVANALRAIDTDADAVTANADADRLANEALDLVTRQYQLGAVSYLASLDAQRTVLSTRLALVQARAARFTDTAALFQALGGGWWNAPDAVASAASASTATR
ncbi:MAG: efflux transporter outer membrane subunit, partial [Caulobacter sp.]|nr:efflux transporter outer membrane subunit [Vitreoscilla sp.]